MDLTEMRGIVRRDLHDEDENNYRWTDDELDRHIAHAVKDYSEALPLEQKAAVDTVAGSREIDVSTIIDRVMIEAAEYPTGKFPPRYQRFSLWADMVTLLGGEVPDGSEANIYYGAVHTLNESGSTVPAIHEDLIAAGACGYAAVEWAIYAINRVNTGGTPVPNGLKNWGKEKLDFFRAELKRLGRRRRVRTQVLYAPYREAVGKSTDPGPG
jgi:hypothetical protein